MLSSRGTEDKAALTRDCPLGFLSLSVSTFPSDSYLPRSQTMLVSHSGTVQPLLSKCPSVRSSVTTNQGQDNMYRGQNFSKWSKERLQVELTETHSKATTPNWVTMGNNVSTGNRSLTSVVVSQRPPLSPKATLECL